MDEAIRIPPEIIQFLEGATFAFAGTRDHNLVPHVHRVTGWIVGSDGRTLTCLIPAAFTKHLVSSLENNGQFAVTFTASTTGPNRSNPPNLLADAHETYQIKGEYVSGRAVNTEDLEAYRAIRERFGSFYSRVLGFPEEVVKSFLFPPDYAITFQIREIYEQTPGPNAGRRLIPRVEQ